MVVHAQKKKNQHPFSIHTFCIISLRFKHESYFDETIQEKQTLKGIRNNSRATNFQGHQNLPLSMSKILLKMMDQM